MTAIEHTPAKGYEREIIRKSARRDLTMTLSQIIKLRTNNGRTVADFLVDVMQDRYDDFQMCHRLQAARLLTTYGNEDAQDFIDDNTSDSSSNTRKRKPRRPTRFDTELARVIREDTDDGRSIARFLVNVMEGEFKSFRPHHRMAAARELLDRGFGKSARKETPTPVVPAEAGTQTGPGGEALTPGNPDPTEEPNPPANETNEITLIPESQKSEFRQSTNEHTLTPNQTDILDTLIHLQPDRFEQTVLDLLERHRLWTRPPSRTHRRRRHRRHHQPGPPRP